MMRALHLLMLTALLLFVAACGRGSDAEKPGAASPDVAVEALAASLQNNDVQSFVRGSLSDEDYAAARREWDEARTGAMDAEERENLNAALAALADENAVDQLMAEIGPALEAARPNLPIMLMAAQTMAHASVSANETLTEAQKNAANELLGAFGKWAGGKDLADPELARSALTKWVEGARKIELRTADELQALEFEEMLERAGILMAALDESLGVYDLGLGEIFASADAEVLRQQGDTALVRVRFDLLDTTQQFDMVMLRSDQRWIPQNLKIERPDPNAEPAETL